MSRQVGASGSPRLSQYINLSNYAYSSGLTPPNPNLLTKLHLAPLVSNGQDVESLDSLTGFYGQAFVTTGKKHDVIVAFEGTNKNGPNPIFVGAQVVDDGQIFLGDNANSYASALNFTQQAEAVAASQGVGASHVYLTGHSLGAADAEYVASKTGLAGDTFGTPGIVAAPGSPPSHLHNFVEQGDPVGNYASNPPDYLGDIVQSGAIQHYGRTTLVGAPSHAHALVQARNEYNYFDFPGALSLVAKNAELYHPLGTYAYDLHVRLYGEDSSAGSDSGFFGASAGGLLGLAKSNAVAKSNTAKSNTAESNTLAQSDAAVCYAEGTRIRTPDGDVAIERLAVGDEVLTAGGARKPIRWLGRRRIDCRRHKSPHLVQPIRIAAHAFAENRPARDLVVSPGHAICVAALGEVLVPAAALVNGTTVTRCDVAHVTYWHLELDAHDIVLAENLAAESYLDCGNRGFFGADGLVAMHATPDQADAHARFCRPYHADGAVVAALRTRLRARAAVLAATEPEPMLLPLAG